MTKHFDLSGHHDAIRRGSRHDNFEDERTGRAGGGEEADKPAAKSMMEALRATVEGMK